MKFFCTLLLVSSFNLSLANAAESNFHGKGLDGKDVTLEGYIKEEPKLHSGYNGKYVSYTFDLTVAKDASFGDEFVMVTFNTVKWCKEVGKFDSKKGDKVKLHGRYTESKGKGSSGLIGSLAVNDVSISDSNSYPAVCYEP